MLLCCKNVVHAAAVNHIMTISASEPESQRPCVVTGGNLSKISNPFYGTPGKYTQTFKTSKPMPSHPGKIHPA